MENKLGPYQENSIVVGDCLDVMSEMPDGCVDLVVTDPPYGLDGDFSISYKAIQEARRVSRLQIIILDWRNPLAISDGKFAELVWEYGWVSGGRTKSNHFYPTHNTIHFLGDSSLFKFDTKQGSILKRRPGFSSPRQTSYAKKTGHPYEKPVKLMEYLIERANAGLVFDPFMGSGTTAIAADRLNRRFFGCDINPNYVQMALERLEKDRLGRSQLEMKL